MLNSLIMVDVKSFLSFTLDDVEEYAQSLNCPERLGVGPSIVLPNGDVYDLTSVNLDGDATHSTFFQLIFDSLAQDLRDEYPDDEDVDDEIYRLDDEIRIMDYVESDLGIITLNEGRTYIEPRAKLVALKKPTDAQYEVIEEYLDEVQKYKSAVYCFLTDKSDFVSYRFDEYTTDEIIEKLKRTFAFGRVFEDANDKNIMESSKEFKCDTFRFNGRKAWSGAVNVLDGEIEETHRYKEAMENDFHHSFYFSDEQLDKMTSGETCFFYVDGDGIHVDPTERVDGIDKRFLEDRIKEQIKVIVEESIERDDERGSAFNEYCIFNKDIVKSKTITESSKEFTRDKDGREYNIWTECTGGYSGQSDYMKIAYVGDNWMDEHDRIIRENILGYLQYSVADDEEDTAYIQMIEVKESERRKGIATALVDSLKKEYKEINWGYTTNDGTKFYNSCNKINESAHCLFPEDYDAVYFDSVYECKNYLIAYAQRNYFDVLRMVHLNDSGVWVVGEGSSYIHMDLEDQAVDMKLTDSAGYADRYLFYTKNEIDDDVIDYNNIEINVYDYGDFKIADLGNDFDRTDLYSVLPEPVRVYQFEREMDESLKEGRDTEDKLKQVHHFKRLQEYIETNEFQLGTAGYIKEDGSLIILDEYHGEDKGLQKMEYPEFSNTHAEEDTCVRIFNEPNEIQYKKLEEIIDKYLDIEDYCKVEIWKNNKPDFYKVFSLREGACQDYHWGENIGNWTGYKLVRMIKNYFHLNEKIVKKGSKWQVQSEKVKNLGIYDTKAEAEKRLKQVHYFKHVNEDNSLENKFYRWQAGGEHFNDVFSDEDIEYMREHISTINTPIYRCELLSDNNNKNLKVGDIINYDRFRSFSKDEQGFYDVMFMWDDVVEDEHDEVVCFKTAGQVKIFDVEKEFDLKYDDLVDDDFGKTLNTQKEIFVEGKFKVIKKEEIYDDYYEVNHILYTIEQIDTNLKESLKEKESVEETDNEGNPLSKEQIEFFKDSKVRNSKGKLIVCYHGTDVDFDEFDISKSGKNGANLFGKGHYFTMSSNNEYGKVQKKCYLNITNPMLGGKSWIDYCKKNGREWYYYPDLTKQLREDGYDGLMSKDNDTVVAFESNQIKSIDNKNPTNSNNINEGSSGVLNKQKYQNKKLKKNIVKIAKDNNFEGIIDTKELSVHHLSDTYENGLKDNSYKNIWFIKSKDWKDRELLHKLLHYMDRNEVSYKELLSKLEDIKLYQYDDVNNRFVEKTLSTFRESLTESKQDDENFKKWLDDAYQKVGRGWSDSDIDVSEYMRNANDCLALFQLYRKDNSGKETDYYYWMKRDPSEFFYFLARYAEKRKDKKELIDKENSGAERVVEDEFWYVYKITSYEASRKYGRNTTWCITDEDDWDSYRDNWGIEYFLFFIPKDDSKYMRHAVGVSDDEVQMIFNQEDCKVEGIPNVPTLPDGYPQIPDAMGYDFYTYFDFYDGGMTEDNLRDASDAGVNWLDYLWFLGNDEDEIKDILKNDFHIDMNESLVESKHEGIRNLISGKDEEYIDVNDLRNVSYSELIENDLIYNSTKTLFHCTSKSNIENIRKNGLVADGGKLWSMSNDAVYLALDEDDAIEYYYDAVEYGLIPQNEEPIVFEIDVDELDKDSLYVDANEDENGYCIDGKLNLMSLEYRKSIPYSSLKVVERQVESFDEHLTEAKADTERFLKWISDGYKSMKYSDWASGVYAKEAVNVFNKYKNSLKGEQRDIYSWMKKPFSDFASLVSSLKKKEDEKAEVARKEDEGAELVYENDDWLVYKITTYEASVKYGKGTKWCISGSKRWENGENGRKHWDNYHENGIFFYFFINRKSGRKYAIAIYPDLEHYEIFNDADIAITYIPDAPYVKQVAGSIIGKELEAWYAEVNPEHEIQSLIAEGKVDFNFIRQYLNDCDYNYNEGTLALYNNVDDFVKDLDWSIPDEYLEWEAVLAGKMSAEQYKKLTGYDYAEEWVGDVPQLTNWDELKNWEKGKKAALDKSNFDPGFYLIADDGDSEELWSYHKDLPDALLEFSRYSPRILDEITQRIFTDLERGAITVEEVFNAFDLSEDTKDNLKQMYESLSLKEELVYHGSIDKGLKKLDRPTNWVTSDFDYAKYYATSLKDEGSVYTLDIELSNLFDVGNTGLPVYLPLPFGTPKPTSETIGLAKKLNLSDEELNNLLNEVLDEFGLTRTPNKLRLSTVVRSLAFKKLLVDKGYSGVSAIEFNVPKNRYCRTYGIFDELEPIDEQEVRYDESLDKAHSASYNLLEKHRCAKSLMHSSCMRAIINEKVGMKMSKKELRKQIDALSESELDERIAQLESEAKKLFESKSEPNSDDAFLLSYAKMIKARDYARDSLKDGSWIYA